MSPFSARSVGQARRPRAHSSVFTSKRSVPGVGPRRGILRDSRKCRTSVLRGRRPVARLPARLHASCLSPGRGAGVLRASPEPPRPRLRPCVGGRQPLARWEPIPGGPRCSWLIVSRTWRLPVSSSARLWPVRDRLVDTCRNRAWQLQSGTSIWLSRASALDGLPLVALGQKKLLAAA